MPESRRRKRAAYTPPPTRSARKRPSPPWLAPLMVALFVVGLLWLAVFYISGSALPIRAWGNWNVLIGFGWICAGFGLATQWR